MYTNCATDVGLKTVILRLGLLQQNKEFYQTSKSHYNTGSESLFFSGLEIALHQVAPTTEQVINVLLTASSLYEKPSFTENNNHNALVFYTLQPK